MSALPRLCLLTAVLAACSGSDEGARTDTQWLREVTSSAGLDFRQVSGGQGRLRMPEIMGGGAALFDADGDGDLDAYLVNAGFEPGTPGPAPEAACNRFFTNDGAGRFTDATDASGLGDREYGMGVCIGDVDGDGDEDVYVTNFGPDRLYLNDGAGRFDDATRSAGIDVPGWSCSAAFFDYDRDGDLDLYVTQYVDWDAHSLCHDQAGREVYCGPLTQAPISDVLLANEGNGHFRDVSGEAGLKALAAAGLGVVCEDFDGDGWTDVFVANDAYENHLWINRGGESFEECALFRGVAYNLLGQAEAGMGVVAEDLDGDGTVDLFLTHLQEETNSYYRGLGGERGFVDDTGRAGLGASSMASTGFGVAAFDVELDGDLDLCVANGRVKRGVPGAGCTLPEPWSWHAEPNLFYVNDGQGRFTSAAEHARDVCAPLEISRALAAGDVDGDGDIDVLLTNIEGPARLFLGDAPRAGSWLLVDARDGERVALGAHVQLTVGEHVRTRTVRAACGYLASSDPRVHFGVARAAAIEGVAPRLEVTWIDGARERFVLEGLDRVVRVTRGTGEEVP